jgi:hypothetical protein
MSAAIRPDDVLVECARAGVILKPSGAPGKVKLTGPAEAVRRLLPLVERHKAELLGALAERRLIANGYVPANRQELARMAARIERAEALGLSEREADELADRLLRRDREGLRDMHLCVECARLRADATGWRCAAIRAPIPSEWVTRQLQRCGAFLRLEPATTGLQPR